MSDTIDFTGDEYWGKGGSYVVNPATGKREPAGTPVTPQPAAAVYPAPIAAAEELPPVAVTPALKEKNRA